MKEIEASCAVKVKIPRGEDWKGFIIVSGDFEGVAMARDKILSIVQERANKASSQIEIDRNLALSCGLENFPEFLKKTLRNPFHLSRFHSTRVMKGQVRSI